MFKVDVSQMLHAKCLLGKGVIYPKNKAMHKGRYEFDSQSHVLTNVLEQS